MTFSDPKVPRRWATIAELPTDYESVKVIHWVADRYPEPNTGYYYQFTDGSMCILYVRHTEKFTWTDEVLVGG